MQKSTYYDLNLVEGADVYNPLINDVPNYETIDQAMHDNAVAGVTVATELASGNVHAITRNNPECSVIRFVATSDWKSNDRMTIDGTEVTVRMVDGKILKNNAYLINSNVLGVLTGTLFTVYAEPFVPENASDSRFNDEENVHDAIIKDREDIALLNSNLKIIFEETVTTTTNAYGFFGWICNTDRIILSVRASDKILVPFIFDNAWYVVELNQTASGGLVGNKTFDVTMTYILK